jgi:hypothetical protein
MAFYISRIVPAGRGKLSVCFYGILVFMRRAARVIFIPAGEIKTSRRRHQD